MGQTPSKILKWREYVPEAADSCSEQFGYLLDDFGLSDLDPSDTFSRICHRYCGYAKTIHMKRTEYFTSLWTLHGLANQFSNIAARWFVPLLEKRLPEDKRHLLTKEASEELVRWASTRYNFWLGQQL